MGEGAHQIPIAHAPKISLENQLQLCVNTTHILKPNHMYNHVSCKNFAGLQGLFEDQARQRGIHLIWVEHDLMDPRTVSRKAMRDRVNRYMTTVFRAEPLDPTLVDYDDDLTW